MTTPDGARVLVEAAIDTADDAARAVQEGADRLEVCAALDVGGLTPSPALLGACLGLGVPCVAMARPRAGDFAYSPDELRALERAAADLVSRGAHGVVFGCLRPDRTVHAEAVRAVVARAGRVDTVFHRAFDETPDAEAALEALVDCGIVRVLTSGHAPTATDGRSGLARLIARARNRLEVLPGGSVRGHNVRALIADTGARQVHARASVPGVIAAIRQAVDHA